QNSARGHRIDGIQHQVADRTPQLLAIARNPHLSPGKVQVRFNLRSLAGLQLRAIEFNDAANNSVEVHSLETRRWHLGEIAEPSDDRLEVSYLCEQRTCA